MNSSSTDNITISSKIVQEQSIGSFTENPTFTSSDNISNPTTITFMITQKMPSETIIKPSPVNQPTKSYLEKDSVPYLISDGIKDISEYKSVDEYMYDFEEEEEEENEENDNRFDITVQGYHGCPMQFINPMIFETIKSRKTNPVLNQGGFSTMGGLRLPGLKMNEDLYLNEDNEDLY
ncbi:uncharacterized protein SAPINGB_P002332 [Magnusiomyces paraingens]|uniref:Uncharacterized protein n=1 Tax=Magnusiomyces paraingens TaxID=2606893 RepID=A0A5E8BDD3_9ASCO|nr:uncharacterized protein SAPINGB_P002332 [Saprochaete ingens]VVT49565.1 unnamed protein product [Saprochaete ingens]